MTTVRQGTAGATRTCPHCRAIILESASVCPACQHHLRFDPGAAERAVPSFLPLRVEGTIRHPSVGEPWEYSVVLSIRNDRGEEIARQVVGVGALQPLEQRTFTLAVEVFTPADAKLGRGIPGR
jgi:hypothetical protein